MTNMQPPWYGQTSGPQQPTYPAQSWNQAPQQHPAWQTPPRPAAQWAQQQTWPQPEQRASRRPFISTLGTVGVVAVVLIVLAAMGVFARAHDVSIAFTLSDSDLGDSCQGSGGYSDIGSGTPVRLTDESGQLLGAASLGRGSYFGGGCIWSVTIPNVGSADFYSVEVGSRGAITSSADEMEANGWSFSVSLG